MWGAKLCACMLYDLFDMTIGRILFVAPFSGEIIGCVLCASFFGWRGVFYGLEAIDPTEQLDGFLPMATIIAFANRPQPAETSASVQSRS
ncbi:MAG: hypothetical protein QOD42_3738 [Sphingomonadales bacterium]|nr:hypothetical protein [Sphingomonadales bacterium]